jgi:endonuclease-8
MVAICEGVAQVGVAPMPEGHVLHRAARSINAAIKGKVMERVSARNPSLAQAGASRRLTGAVMTGADARGKTLLLNFDNGYSIYSHLKMDGAWHTVRTGERWRTPGASVWLVLDSGEWQALNINGPNLELHVTEQILRDKRIASLGPDVLVEPFDDEEYLRRMRTEEWRELGDAIMQQRLVAGIGNIYKAESLFMAGLSPWRRVADTSDEELIELRRIASKIMLDGVLDPRAITYRGSGPVGRWAYSRGGEPCRRCSTPIESRLQGTDQRITWWCPVCQS